MNWLAQHFWSANYLKITPIEKNTAKNYKTQPTLVAISSKMEGNPLTLMHQEEHGEYLHHNLLETCCH